MQRYDEAEEEAITAAAIETADAKAFEAQLHTKAAPFLQGGGGLIAELYGQLLSAEALAASTVAEDE